MPLAIDLVSRMFLVSIHVNAARMAKCIRLDVYICQGQTQSYKLAESLCQAAIKNFPGHLIRTDMSDGDMDWEEGFYILRKSLCVAVLTENFFMGILDLILSICRAELVSTLWLILMWKGLWTGWR